MSKKENQVSTIEDPEARKKQIARRWKVGLALLVGFVAAPFVVTGIKGLVGLVVIWLMATAAVQFAPVVSMKMANRKLKALKSEAADNPIETMQNIYAEKSQEIVLQDQKIVEFAGRAADFEDKVVGLRKKFPEDAAKFDSAIEAMKRSLVSKRRRQREAKLEQDAYSAQIERAVAVMDVAKSMQSAAELSAEAEQKVFRDIKNQVAFDTINHRFNTVVAALAAEVDDDKAFVIDVSPESPKQIAAAADTISDPATSREKVTIDK